MAYCWRCDQEVGNATRCPRCGVDVGTSAAVASLGARRVTRVALVTLVMALALVVGGAALRSRDRPAPTTTSRTIPPATNPSPTTVPAEIHRRLFVRTTAEGVTIRGHVVAIAPPGGCAPDRECPVWFLPLLSTPEAVGFTPHYFPPEVLAPGKLGVHGPTYFGIEEGSPVTAYVVAAATDVTTVRIRYLDGFTDEAVVVEEWTVLAHRGLVLAEELEALDADGAFLGSEAVRDVPLLSPSRNSELRPLFSRTTADGITIRAFALPRSDGDDGDTAVEVGLSNEGAIYSWSGATTRGDLDFAIAYVGIFGYEEQSPASFVVVSASANITRVRVTYPGGYVDEMEPKEGLAVFARQGVSVHRSIEGLDDAGEVVAVCVSAAAGCT